MSMKASLSPKHWKAIELIEGGKTTMKEIAQICGFKPDTLYKLYEGADQMRETGQLFHAEILKISKKHEKEIDRLLKENKTLALRLLNDFLIRHAALEYNGDDDVKLISTVTNALSKVAPTTQVNATSYTYVKGLSAEELMHEFNKLKSIAEGPSLRGGVSEAGSRISGALSESSEPGSGSGEESEDSNV